MGKSVNDYYSDKMKKLLEEQKKESTPGIAAPQRRSPGEKLHRNENSQSTPKNNDKKARKINGDGLGAGWAAAVRGEEREKGRDYYDKFRRGETSAKKNYQPPRARADEVKGGGATPEQTLENQRLEEERREEAEFIAMRARRRRKIRDSLISSVLILAVTVVICVVLYKLVFVISHINVEGEQIYTEEEIINASGVREGDNLYSFRGSTAEKLITLRCPGVGMATVDKIAPSTVNLYIEEDGAEFYADFYGEYRELSGAFRVMYATDKEKAVSQNLVYVKLPAVRKAFSGEKPEFAEIRSDAYIYDVIDALKDSGLWGKVNSIDLRNKYNVTVNCDGKYQITLGDASSLTTKLKIVCKVLEDEMFNSGDKAKINVSDMTETSVVVDNTLVID